MNLIQIQDRLKDLPNTPQAQQALMAYANGSNPQVPPYLALAELSRRKQLQDKMAAEQQAQNAPQGTVKDQLEQSAGLLALQKARQQQAMQQMAQGAAQQMPNVPGSISAAGPVQAASGGLLSRLMKHPRYNSGGIVVFKEGSPGEMLPESGSISDQQREREVEEAFRELDETYYPEYVRVPRGQREKRREGAEEEALSEFDETYYPEYVRVSREKREEPKATKDKSKTPATEEVVKAPPRVQERTAPRAAPSAAPARPAAQPSQFDPIFKQAQELIQQYKNPQRPKSAIETEEELFKKYPERFAPLKRPEGETEMAELRLAHERQRAEDARRAGERQAAKPGILSLLADAALESRGQYGTSALATILGRSGQMMRGEDAKMLAAEQEARTKELERQQAVGALKVQIEKVVRARARGDVEAAAKAEADFIKFSMEHGLKAGEATALLANAVSNREHHLATAENQRVANQLKAEELANIKAEQLRVQQEALSQRARKAFEERSDIKRLRMSIASAEQGFTKDPSRENEDKLNALQDQLAEKERKALPSDTATESSGRVVSLRGTGSEIAEQAKKYPPNTKFDIGGGMTATWDRQKQTFVTAK